MVSNLQKTKVIRRHQKLTKKQALLIAHSAIAAKMGRWYRPMGRLEREGCTRLHRRGYLIRKRHKNAYRYGVRKSWVDPIWDRIWKM